MSITKRLVGGAALMIGIVAQSVAGQAVAQQTAPTPTPAAAAAAAAKAKAKAKAKAQPRDTATTIEVYGFAQADAIYDFKQNNPDWFDVNRPSRLPKTKGEFGRDGRTWFSIRQSRFGVKASIPTGGKDIKATFEWDLFGVGSDAGQTTIRPRTIYGQWGQFGAGQLNSPFMDSDVFPNSLEYWGPNGMLFFRNVQIFWQPINRANGTRFTLALERPGASGDAGIYADRVELQNIRPRNPAPDISGEYRWGGGFGYVELASIVRWIAWDDVLDDAFNLSGSTTGWGVSLSSSLNLGKSDVLRLQGIYGAGVENYFNDAPIDIGVKNNPGNPVKPVTGEALPDLGLTAFLDHRWNSHLTTALGYSRVDISNSDAQAATAFKSGQYALINLLWTPARNVMVGGEFQWGHRDNFGGDFKSDDYRFQFSVKYNFSQKFGGNGHEDLRAQD